MRKQPQQRELTDFRRAVEAEGSDLIPAFVLTGLGEVVRRGLFHDKCLSVAQDVWGGTCRISSSAFRISQSRPREETERTRFNIKKKGIRQRKKGGGKDDPAAKSAVIKAHKDVLWRKHTFQIKSINHGTNRKPLSRLRPCEFKAI